MVVHTNKIYIHARTGASATVTPVRVNGPRIGCVHVSFFFCVRCGSTLHHSRRPNALCWWCAGAGACARAALQAPCRRAAERRRPTTTTTCDDHDDASAHRHIGASASMTGPQSRYRYAGEALPIQILPCAHTHARTHRSSHMDLFICERRRG